MVAKILRLGLVSLGVSLLLSSRAEGQAGLDGDVEAPVPPTNPGPYSAPSPGLNLEADVSTFDGGVIQRFEDGQLVTSTPIANWDVQSLSEIEGRLYVGTSLGLYFLDLGSQTWAHRSPAEGLSSYSIYDLEKSGGDLLVATSAGLNRSSDMAATFTAVTSSAGFKGDNARQPGRFADGALAVGSSSGLYLSNHGQTFVHKRNIYVSDLLVRGGLSSGSAQIFAASNRGVSRSVNSGTSFDEIHFEEPIHFSRHLERIAGLNFLAVVVGYQNSDSDDLYICTTPLAVNPSCTALTTISQLYEANVTSLEADGNFLWVGLSNGLLRLNLTSHPSVVVEDWSQTAGLNVKSVTEFLKTSNGDLYAGTDSALFRRANGSSSLAERSPPRRLGSNVVKDLVRSNWGELWGATSRGLTRIDNQGLASRPEALSQRSFHQIEIDSSGKIFAAAREGIFKSSDGGISWVQYTIEFGLSHNWTNRIFVSASGDLWAATWLGLNRLKVGDSNFETLLPEKIWDVRVLSGGMILAATEAGLKFSTYSGQTFEVIERPSDFTKPYPDISLGDNIVYSIFDFSGRIFAGTNGGLSLSDDGGLTFVNRHRDHGLWTSNVYRASALGWTVALATVPGVALSMNNASDFVLLPTPGHPVPSVLVKTSSASEEPSSRLREFPRLGPSCTKSLVLSPSRR